MKATVVSNVISFLKLILHEVRPLLQWNPVQLQLPAAPLNPPLGSSVFVKVVSVIVLYVTYLPQMQSAHLPPVIARP